VVTVAPEDLEQVRQRQNDLKTSMRSHNVRHPADLPIEVILAHRAARLRAESPRLSVEPPAPPELDLLEDLEAARVLVEMARQKLLRAEAPALEGRKLEVLYFLRNHAAHLGKTIETVRGAV
jgi:hypothetical protein